ncbi:histidine kinase, partial [Fusobacterium simiae]|nr:histidine kinase [Fusobacterium simiae]
MKFILNDSMTGINGIEKISLKEVVKKFSYPEKIKIKVEKEPYNIDFELKYK